MSRIHVIESILQPNRTMVPGYRTLDVELKDGRVLSGVRTAETATTVIIGDSQGQLHHVVKSEIVEISELSLSAMPDGLEKQLSHREFLDLIEDNPESLLDIPHDVWMERGGAEAVEMMMWLTMRGALTPEVKKTVLLMKILSVKSSS